MNQATMRARQRQVEDYDIRFPIGTPCVYWTGTREGPGIPSRIRSEWAVVCGTVVVWVEGHPACIAASHVDIRRGES